MATATAPTRQAHHAGNTYTMLDTAALQAENEQLRYALQQAGAAIDERDETIAKLNAALRFEYDVRRNAALGAGPRHTLIALRRHMEHCTPESGGWIQYYREDLASVTGQSSEVIS